MSEPAQKCKTMNAILSKTLELIFAFKMNHSCSFRLRGNLDFLEFLPNFFITFPTARLPLAQGESERLVSLTTTLIICHQRFIETSRTQAAGYLSLKVRGPEMSLILEDEDAWFKGRVE